MNYDGYRLLFIISLCISIFLFLLSLFLFIRLKIAKIIGELTGLSAKMNIKKMKFISHQNSGNIFKFNSGGINSSGKIDKSKNISNKNQDSKLSLDENKTEILVHERVEDTDLTEILRPKTITDEENSLTEVLLKESNSTTKEVNVGNEMHVVEDITFIHSDENNK